MAVSVGVSVSVDPVSDGVSVAVSVSVSVSVLGVAVADTVAVEAVAVGVAVPVAVLPVVVPLAVAVGADIPWNGLITPVVDNTGATRFRLFVQNRFDSVEELIQYYAQHPVAKSQPHGAPVMLRL